jgi:hypothetical protein
MMQLGDSVWVNLEGRTVPGQLRFVVPLAEHLTAIPGRIIAADGGQARVRLFEGTPHEAETWVPAERVTARLAEPTT